MIQIKKILTGGLIAYLVIGMWQVISHPEISLQALALGVFLGILTGIAWISDEEMLKQTEMVIMWICVGLFGLFAMLVAGGIV